MFIQHSSDGSPRLVTSASDLTAASTCEFAFLRRVDARFGRDVEVPPDDDAMMERAARLGDAHEARLLAAYRAELGDGEAGRPGGVVSVARADSRDEAALLAAQELTVSAMHGGADVVFQATFFDPAQRPAGAEPGDPAIGFIGYADFLRRMPSGAYEVQDAKLARRAKVTALMQLAAYAEQLERVGVAVAAHATLLLGDGARSTHQLVDVAPVFRSRRRRLNEILLDRARATGGDGRRESAAPITWGAAGIAFCGQCEVCLPEVERTRDPLLIADIRVRQRNALVAAGYDTIDAVAELALRAAPPSPRALAAGGSRRAATVSAPPPVEGMAPAVIERLAWQAALQVDAGSAPIPPVRVVDPSALAAIPAPNPGDLFFDFEGDPLYREPGDNAFARWGIDYLFGMVDASEQFTAFWAHDLDAEREALEQFLALVAERRARYPDMRIYHYAPYERTHLVSIAARHGVGEAEVDQLLREHVLVDLFQIVRKALRVGSRSYSIKKLEPLYMGDELRDEGGVTNAAQSVTEYAEASALLGSESAAEQAEGRARLDAIADYNRYDCVSTLRLRDWLLRLAAECGVVPAPATLADDETERGEFALSPVAVALARHEVLAEDPRDRKAAALAGSAIDYYQREQKSFWVAHYARLLDPIEDWADTRDVMVVDARACVVESDWEAPTGRQRNHRRTLRLRGEIAPGSSLKPGAGIYLVYEYPPPEGLAGDRTPGSRGVTRPLVVLERHDDGVTVEELRSADVPEYDELPIALTPGPPPRPGQQKPAIEEWGAALVDAFDRGETFIDPVFDIMRRVPPRLEGGAPLVSPDSDEALLAGDGSEDRRMIGAVVASLRKLRHSTLAVQGPPGTGKTYLAARVIRELVEREGWLVGVVAQSHKVVENVLEGVVAAGLDPEQVGKAPQGGRLDPEAPLPAYTVLGTGDQARFLRDHRAAGRGAVVGGTAWDFANESRVPRKSLDLLVIDEAGQFSLAPTIAASVAAERLLLLGDPQQLPQVSQGSHPEPVDTSALGWLLGEHDTLPADAGYFLAETRRMRPELASIVSELSYDGRLHAHPSAGLRTVDGAGPAGLIWHPVDHSNNATSSTEEAEEVVRIARGALAGVLHEPGRPPRALEEADVIVVAPYNAQVERIAEALGAAGFSEIRVGTVDRFQGQEAVIAIVSLAASSAEDVPRGMEFLLMRNRLNVAISRAQWAAHLVSSSRLGQGLPASAEGVAALSGYLRLTERGRVA
ncbi:MAG: TM0106 family RecB-like putative nuclease [Leucobacter sp.]|nr:TM0106 family RecB-like putative nuclease [Leucobacter sp.]